MRRQRPTIAPTPTTATTLVALLSLALLAPTTALGWDSDGKWPTGVVGYKVNPSNQDVSDAAALKAVRWGATAWTKQSGAAFRFRYDGSTTSTSVGLDNKNLVLFRNTAGSSPTVRATTYTYRLLGIILDTDIVFWDKTMSFTTNDADTPCNDQIIIEHTAIHEFGHALGLEHSTDDKATMWGKAGACSTFRLTLHSDDIAGVEKLYPCSNDSQCNDGNPCTDDVCNGGRCERTPKKCGDGDACTKDTCDGGVCKHAPIANCCTKDSHCGDGDPCTTDTCDLTKKRCTHAPIDDCCAKSAECDDGDPCTTDTCNSSHACVFKPLDCCPGPCDAGALPADGGHAADAGATPADPPIDPLDPGNPPGDPRSWPPETPTNDTITGAGGCALGRRPAPTLGWPLLLLLLRRRNARE